MCRRDPIRMVRNMTSTTFGTDRGVDVDRAITTLVTAFAADPVIRWLYRDPGRYLMSFAGLAQLLGGDAFAAGTAVIAPGYRGTALWLAPDAPSDDAAVVAHLERSVDADRMEAVLALLGQVADHHPAQPVWYLPFVGVDPAHQGRGLGAQLLRAGLDRADRDRLPAYLEASTARNRALYERHGFEVVGELRAADSPPLWPMLRPAGGDLP